MSTMLVGKKVFTVTSSTSSSISREETLSKDMFEAVKKRNITGDQAGVDGILDEGKVNLGTFVEEGGKKRTVLKMLLEDCVNGDKIVQRQLDQNVRQLEVDKDSIEYGTQIAFEGIFGMDNSLKQMVVVKELLGLRTSAKEGEQRDAFTRCLSTCSCSFGAANWRIFHFQFSLPPNSWFLICLFPNRLIGHPVIATLIHTKWKKTQW